MLFIEDDEINTKNFDTNESPYSDGNLTWDGCNPLTVNERLINYLNE